MAIFAFSLLLVGLHVRAYPKLSPIDELQHLDYAVQASQFRFVKTGDRVGQEAMRVEACRGIDSKFGPPRCGTTLVPAQFQEDGFNTAEVHPPTYYLITGLVGRVFLSLHLAANFFDAARLVGGLWLGLGLILTWLIAAELGAGNLATGAVVVLLATTPGLLYASSIVSPDAAGLTAGGLVFLAALKWEKARAPILALPTAAFLALWLKAPYLLAVLAAAAYLGLRAWRSPNVIGEARRRRSEYVWAGTLAIAGGVAGEGAWFLLRRLLAGPHPQVTPMATRLRTGVPRPTDIIAQIPGVVTPISRLYSAAFITHRSTVLGVFLFNLLLVTACFGGVIFARELNRQAAMSAATSLLMLAGGPIIFVATFAAVAAIPDVASRYGFALLPVLASLAAVAAARRWSMLVVAGLSTFCALAALYPLWRTALG